MRPAKVRREASLKVKRHSPAEVSAKLAQAARLAVAGKRQSEIATALGVSIMTLHRWRKPDNLWAARMGGESRDSNNLLVELQTENRRLRDLVMNLLLEKIKLEESTSLRAA
jgi:putative transposase